MQTAPLTLTGAIPLFRQHLLAVGKADKTVSAYERDIRHIAETAGDPDLSMLDSEALDEIFANPAFRQSNRGTQRAPHTVNRAKASMRSFLHWAGEAGHVPDTLYASVKCKQVAAPTPTFLTEQECRAVIKALKERNHENALRNQTIIEVFIGTGIRLAELVALNVEDIDLATKHISIRSAKGGQPQTKFIKTDLRTLLVRYLKWRNKHAPMGEAALFTSTRGGRISVRQVAYLVEDAAKRAGIEKDVTPHALRHSFATLLLGKTGNLPLVQRALGHKHISTTVSYTHIVDSELEDALETL